ncbi:MAG: hypothetical protein Q9202_004290 [Teloschistes flavicans]
MPLDLNVVRNADKKELAHYYMRLRHQHDSDQITHDLFRAIGNESLPPTVFGIWLTVCRADIALKQALHYPNSCLVRKFAIKQLGRRLRTSSWEMLWYQLRGTEGVLDLFAQLSVVDVGQLSTVIGHCRKGRHRPARDACIEALLRGLLPFFHQGYQPKSTDQRSLVHYYARMLPACSSGFVEKVLSQPENPLLPYVKIPQILRYHPALVQKCVFLAITLASTEERLLPCLPQVAHSVRSGQRDSAGLSSKISYASDVLARVSADDLAHLDSRLVMQDLATPLLHRAMKHRSGTETILEIVVTTLNYVQHVPEAAQYLASNRRGFLFDLIRFWSRHEAQANDAVNRLVIRCLHQLGNHLNHPNTKHLVENLIPNVARKHRYTLLGLVIKHFHRPGADIDDVEQLRGLTLDLYTCHTFIALENDHALRLLSRIAHVKRAIEFLELGGYNSIFNHPVVPDGRYADTRLLEIYLSRPELEGLARVERDIHELQRKSSTSREQSDRAFFAKSAMFYAIASGSLALYGEVLTWSRRYIKDPLTIKTIYGEESLLTVQGIDLLSGFQSTTSGLLNPHPETWRVAEANKILLDLFEIACLASGQPSFSVYDWSATRAVYRRVTKSRLHVAGLLYKRFKLTDDTLYDHVWQGTLTTLLNLETRACKAEHEVLAFNSASGPLGPAKLLVDGTDGPRRHAASSYRFLDELARARDTLWKKLRSASHPAAASLQPPWRKGLPIQYLASPVDIARQDAGGQTPFLSLRATEIVFLNAQAALSDVPSTDDDRAAIGSLVDDYKIALFISIMQQPEGPMKDHQVSLAWRHAITSLTGDRMDAQEAIAFWRPIFRHALPGVKLGLPDVTDEIRQFPVLPAETDDDQTIEWDPLSNQPPVVESRDLSILAIDCLVDSSATQLNPSEPVREPRTRTQPFTPLSVWDIRNDLNKFGRLQEGLIASALLYIDSKENKSSRILTEPFPSEEGARYPSMFLDSEFLLKRELHVGQALDMLKRLIVQVPSTLLLGMTSSILETSSHIPEESRETANTTIAAYRLLALTGKCDSPEETVSLVLRAVIDRPEASSWHRQFLSSTLLNRLRPHHAKGLLTSFAELIELKMRLQSDTRTLTNEPPKPMVKVTTIKYLAQLLRNPCFISSEDALSILVSLLGKSAQIDVLVAVVESLLAMLAQNASSDDRTLVQPILGCLQALVSIGGRINERREDEKEPWDSMPVIEDEDNCPPVFGLLLEFASNCQIFVGVRQALVERALLPAFDAIRRTHERWIEVFLARTNGKSVMADCTTSIPPRTTVLATLLQKIPGFLPKSYFELWQRYTIMSLAPSPALVTFNQMLRDGAGDEKGEIDALPPRDGKAINHWLRIYDRSTEVFSQCMLAELLLPDLPFSVTPSKDIQSAVQTYTLEVAHVIIRHFDKLHESWTDFLGPLDASRRGASHERDWYEQCRPIIEGIIQHVARYREDASWRSNKNRNPKFLPDTLELQLMLLRPLTNELPAAQPQDQYCAELFQKLLRLLSDIVANKKAYHGGFKQIEEYMVGNIQFPWIVDAACYFGNITGQNGEDECTTMDYLRVELAHGLLRETATKIHESAEAINKVERLFEQWKDSEVEDFRMRGILGLSRMPFRRGTYRM